MHRESLARASAGVYERARLDNLGAERIARYFKEEPNGHMRIVPELRQRIIFSAHNVVSDPPFTKIDLLTCRNMLIYFQPATQERVLALFHFALRRGGVLFLGSSEGLGGVEGGFNTLAVRHKIYRKSADSLIVPPEIRAVPSARSLRAVATPLAGTLPSTITVSRALLQAYDYLLKEAMPTSFIVAENGEIVQYFDRSSRFLLPPEGRSHDNLYNRTEGDLRLALSTIIPKAIKTGQPALARGVRHRGEGEEQILDVEVKPIPDERNGISLVHVIFLNPREAPAPLTTLENRPTDETFAAHDALGNRVKDLELELHTTKENLQSTVEELQTSNEELQATNEELLAANEELQSTNEELHSVNEELYTVNAEFERKNHELKTIGEDLNNLLASTDIGTLFLDRHLRIRRFTPSIARIFHLLAQDIGRPIDHLAYQLEGETNLVQHLREVLETGTPLEREIRTRDGNWLFQRILPFRTAEEKIDGVVITFTDISGIKSIQDKLNLAMEFSRMVWWEWDLPAQVLNTHTGGQSIFGYAGAVVTTTSEEWRKLIHADDLERVKHSLESCLHGEAARWECQHRFLTRDGQWRWVVNKGKVAARDATGQPIRMLGTTQDIHERCLAEQEIKKLNLALERSPVMVMITDLEGRIEYVNQHFTDVTGYTGGEVIGQNPRMLKATNQPEKTFAELWETLRHGGTWQGEMCNRRKDGTSFWERATIGPLKDADGRITHYVALKEEVTSRKSGDDEQRRMEEQLSQVQRMETLGALAGGIAHDFNNILTAIIGHTQLATDLTSPKHPAAESLQQVRQASRRASDLVQRILSFSRRGPTHREKIDLAALVTEVISLLRASIPSTIKVDISLSHHQLAVLANPTDIQQVVLNLGSNAAHAMREHGGVLRIDLEPRRLERGLKATAGTLEAGNYLSLRVSDTGSGIPPHVMARMFEPFFTTKPSGEGTGLGLSIILGIVLAHGGAIDVQSEPGKGSVFEVLLPAIVADVTASPNDDPPKVTGNGQRIAFVDDEPAIRLMADRGLALHGYSAATFENAHDLLGHLEAKSAPFDLIITDHTMPGMTGLELIRHLRKSSNTAPIIILSGNARYVTAEDLAGLGEVQFMPKPFDLGALLERIAVALALRNN
jgi:two-component system CheB/CheR fusion protein